MKNRTTGFLLGAFLVAFSATAQNNIDSEVPGDNFSLEGALELFKKSSSPEEFEKMLNSPDSKVNNLDLDADGNIDYIRVIDRNERNVHAFILQAVLSESESQDVAVIELEKLADGKAVLQITGDADVYGIETIIEPTEEVRVNAGTTTARNVVNVWTWPSVQYVYGPSYAVWVSPWRWSYYPYWWRPWRPVAYYMYDPWWRPYRPYYAVCHRHRIGYLPVIYRPYRRTSTVVYHHHRDQIDSYRHRYAHSGSGSRSDRYNSDRYSNNARSDGNSRSDRYSGRTRDAAQDNHSGRDRDYSRDRQPDRQSDHFDRGSRSWDSRQVRTSTVEDRNTRRTEKQVGTERDHNDLEQNRKRERVMESQQERRDNGGRSFPSREMQKQPREMRRNSAEQQGRSSHMDRGSVQRPSGNPGVVKREGGSSHGSRSAGRKRE